jgi:hypothetical protein
MRRTIALALLATFSWTLIAPLFAPDSEANLPACCRRHGKHHCMMLAMAHLGSQRPGFTSISEKCPCPPAAACAVHSPTFKPEAPAQFYAEIVRHPSCSAQTQARYRLSFLRSHQKRGPPAPLA